MHTNPFLKQLRAMIALRCIIRICHNLVITLVTYVLISSKLCPISADVWDFWARILDQMASEGRLRPLWTLFFCHFHQMTTAWSFPEIPGN